MLRQRVGDVGVLPLLQRIVAAHDALQFGELADHARHEVRLGEAHGLPATDKVGAGDQGRQPVRQLLQPPGLVADAAELRVKHHLIEHGQAGFQRAQPVPIPEELRVRQPGAQNALVSGPHRRIAVGRLDIRHEQEARREAACPVLHREIALVRLHARHQHFRRQFQEGRVETADARHRPFGQARILCQQTFGEARTLRRPVANARYPFFRVELHEGRPQLRLIVRESGDCEGLRRHEAVAARAGREVEPCLRAADVDAGRQRLAAEDGQHIAQRPDIAHRRIAPAHGFRPGEPARRIRHDVRQHLARRAARHLAHGEPELGLALPAALALVEAREAGRLQEALHRPVRRADARALALLGAVRLALRQVLDDQRNPARRGEGPRASVCEVGFFQPIQHQAFEIAPRAVLHPRRDFLRQQFDEQFAHAAAVSRWPRERSQAPAEARASARTRPI